ncbi:hypothetical protein SAMN05216312_1228 [Cohnella sp. OV330]|uniref:hypothetical protein n=1 Tax=Cohnella sp. OV330 TaxID=1855288 RepID=UPI0008E9630D|nr:hypothetical protein [Cohnella sp. OV330]SFB62518.1 hypothetical protein SAMN05216312_1228 [Cohnella sp. OV330]
MKHLVYDAQTGEETFVDVPDLEPMPQPEKPEPSVESKVAALQADVTQLRTDSADTTSLLLDLYEEVNPA